MKIHRHLLRPVIGAVCLLWPMLAAAQYPPAAYPPTLPPGGAALNSGIYPAPSGFDPYGTGAGAPYGGAAPPVQPPPGYPYSNPYGSPGYADPGAAFNQPPVVYPQYPQPYQPAYPSSGSPFGDTVTYYQRLLQQIRLTGTWLPGSDLETTDVEIAGTFAFPNFLNSAEPLLVSPGFIFHFWSGPEAPLPDLPPRAYSGYLDFGWNPQINPTFGFELGVRPGIYTDFQSTSWDSMRIQGRALAVLRFTPTMTIRAGVLYLDRFHTKLLPAGGVLWTPNPQTRWDIFFPKPKLAHYLTTFGTADLWWYLGAEYGGGAWTVERDSGGVQVSDGVDFNDYRVYLGLEWTTTRRTKGFIELGWVFNREVEFTYDPNEDFDPNDSFMLRGGLVW